MILGGIKGITFLLKRIKFNSIFLKIIPIHWSPLEILLLL